LVNTRQLVEIAGLVAANLPLGTAADHMATEDCLQRGWMAVRGLQRSWLVDLSDRESGTAFAKSATRPPSAEPFAARRFAVAHPATVGSGSRRTADSWFDSAGEGCVAEPAIRAWCAALYRLSRHSRHVASAQLAEQLSFAQNQVRRKILLRLSRESERGSIHAPLDRLRRVGERWADLFTGAICHPEMPEGLAIDPHRAEELSTNLRGASRIHRAAWDLHMAGLRNVYPAFPWSTPTRQRLATGLAEALLGLLPKSMFPNDGTPAPSWWAGLERSRQ
jgi:hypothetical protein